MPPLTVHDRSKLLIAARLDMLRACCPFSAIYAAHDLYLAHSTWLEIPQDLPNPPLSILSHIATGKFYTSSVVGIVNTDDLSVDPTQLCRDGELLSTSLFRFTISPPKAYHICEHFMLDFEESLKNTSILFNSLCSPYPRNHVTPGDGRFHFIHRRFLKISEQDPGIRYSRVSSCPPSSPFIQLTFYQVYQEASYVLPFSIRSGYGGPLLDRFSMAGGSDLIADGVPPHPEGYPDGYFDYDIAPFTVVHRGAEVPTEDIPATLAGSLASVEYTISADQVNGFVASVSEVNILLTAEELSM